MKNKLYTILFLAIIFTDCKSIQTVDSTNGTLENSIDVSYDNHIKNIITTNCISCHSGNYPSAGMSLNNYEKLVNAIKNRELIARINSYSNPMPTSGLMDKSERDLIKSWAKNNFIKKSKIHHLSLYSSFSPF